MNHADFNVFQDTTRPVLNSAQAPWHFQLMLDWEDEDTVVQAYQKLLPRDRAECAILAWSYGNVSAIDFFGSAYHLPKVISGHTG